MLAFKTFLAILPFALAAASPDADNRQVFDTTQAPNPNACLAGHCCGPHHKVEKRQTVNGPGRGDGWDYGYPLYGPPYYDFDHGYAGYPYCSTCWHEGHCDNLSFTVDK